MTIQRGTTMSIFRQGDVLIERVDTAIPAGAEKVKPDAGRVILAYGEVTGHAHALDSRLAQMYRWEGDELIEVKKGAVITHEEHAPIPLEPGVYRIRHQREYHPQELRRVED